MGGLGFNGYDENGKAKWNRVTNANILKIEVRCFFFFGKRRVLSQFNTADVIKLKYTLVKISKVSDQA